VGLERLVVVQEQLLVEFLEVEQLKLFLDCVTITRRKTLDSAIMTTRAEKYH
jgi:hypothetical protein